MKTILDEGVPDQLASALNGHEVSTVHLEGWDGIKNGRLLGLMEQAGFDAVITQDKRMEREQALQRRPFAVLILSCSNWDILSNYIGKVQTALNEAQPGTVTRVDTGKFVPKRFRPLSP